MSRKRSAWVFNRKDRIGWWVGWYQAGKLRKEKFPTKTKAEPAQEKVFQQNYLSSLLAVKLSPQKFNQQLFQLIQIDSPEITGSNQLVYKDQDRVLIALRPSG